YSSGLWEPSFVLNLVAWNMFTEKRAEVYRTLTTAVPMGSTIAYGRLGNICNCSPRAVGSYMRTNKFPIIIPCHRVVGQKSLGGYSPEVQWKRVILEWELNNAKSNSGNRTFWSW
nr:methylated-DNA--[protein]-cysteine S-methyltransferase [Coprothermobacter proteolyticus]